VPVDAAATAITVTLGTTSIFPSTDLNQAGGDEITISGFGLPQDTSKIDVTFSDNTKCTVTSTSDTEVKCTTDGFESTTIDTVNPYSVSLSVNSVTDSTL
jgi:hypothetical protein